MKNEARRLFRFLRTELHLWPLHTLIDQKIDNLQDQLDVMHREDYAFKGFVHRQFEAIADGMATKEDIYRLEEKMATKVDLNKLTEIVLRIAEKVGVKI